MTETDLYCHSKNLLQHNIVFVTYPSCTIAKAYSYGLAIIMKRTENLKYLLFLLKKTHTHHTQICIYYIYSSQQSVQLQSITLTTVCVVHMNAISVLLVSVLCLSCLELLLDRDDPLSMSCSQSNYL